MRAFLSTGTSAPAVGWRFAQHADQTGLAVSRFQPADDAGFIGFAMLFQPRQQPVARSRRAAVLGRHHIDGRRGFVAVPGQRPGQDFAVVIAAGDFDDADFGQFAALW